MGAKLFSRDFRKVLSSKMRNFIFITFSRNKTKMKVNFLRNLRKEYFSLNPIRKLWGWVWGGGGPNVIFHPDVSLFWLGKTPQWTLCHTDYVKSVCRLAFLAVAAQARVKLFSASYLSHSLQSTLVRYMNLLILIFPLRCVTDCIVYCIASIFVNGFYIVIFVVVNMKFLLNGSPVYGQINLFVRSKITKSNKMYGRLSISKSLIRIRSKKVWICNNG